MKQLLAALAASTLLAGCATHAEPQPAVCDGKHRRPANPYGTILPTAPEAKTSGASATASPLAPGPQASIDPKSFAPCGDRV